MLKDAKDFNINEDDFDLALSLLIDACLSRLGFTYHHDTYSVRFYNQYFNRHLIRLYYFFMMANLLTILIEEPASIHVMGQALPFYIPLAINISCDIFFFLRYMHIVFVADWRIMKHNVSIWLTGIFLSCMVFGDLIYGVQSYLQVQNTVRVTRVLRPALLLTFPENKRIRAAFENIRCTALDVLSVFTMFIASLLFASIITLKVLDTKGMRSLENLAYMPDFGEIAWELYILTTTANSPDVIIPAYEKHNAYLSIYVWVCVACNWLFMGILTASVYNAYKSHLGEHVLSSLIKRKKLLDEAFVILQSVDDEGIVSKEIFIAMMQRIMSGRSEASIALIYDILDVKKNGLGKTEFARLTEYMQLHFKEVIISREYFARYLPHFYNIYVSTWYQMIVRIIRSRPMRIFFDVMVITNGLTLILADKTPYEAYFEWTFTGIFAAEILLKYLASGGVNFFQEGWNVFDMFIVIGAFVGQFLNVICEWAGIEAPSSISQAFLLLRLFRLLKIIGQVPIFRCIINCIIIILPSLCAYATILLILYYIFTCVGIELFGGVLYAPSDYNYTTDNPCQNSKLANSSFLQLHYCDLHFNNAASSFVALFVLSVGNNWHIIADGFIRVTNKSYRIFFLLVHWLCVLLVLNIVLAFIIEAFLIEYDPQESRFEEFIRQRMRELGVDAETELSKRGLQGYRDSDFYVTKEQLDAAFPPHQPHEAFSAFYFVPDGASFELLMFRMFETEIEAISTKYHEKPTIRVKKTDL